MWWTLTLKVIAVAAVVGVASLYAQLGPLMPLLYAAGMAGAFAVTGKQLCAFSRPALGFGAVGLGYVVAQVVVLSLVTTESTVGYAMVWRIDPPESGSGDPAVFLEFEHHAGNHVVIHSADVADHLRGSAGETVVVDFSVTRDLGCMRGYHATRIGTLNSWSSGPGGYAGSRGDVASPWDDPWWCP